MKKRLLIPICTALGAAVIGGGAFGIAKYNSSKTVIDVVPVSNISTYYYGYQNTTDGMITSNVTQEIYLMQNQLVKEVYVQEGDHVSIGDQLMAYDTTLTELDLEAKKIALNKINLQIKDLNSDIRDLKNGVIPGDSLGGLAQTGISHILKTSAVADHAGESETTSADPESPTVPSNPDAPTIPSDPDAPTTPSDPDAPTTPQNPEAPGLTGNILDWDTEPVTEGSNLIVECESNWLITPSFIYKLMGYDKDGQTQDTAKILTIILKIKDAASGETFRIRIKGDKLSLPPESTADTTIDDYISNGFEFNLPDDDFNTPDSDDPFFDDGYIAPVYTQEEINQMIKEKQQEIADLELSLKQTNLDITRLEKTLSKSTVTSTVNGIVKTAGTAEEGAANGEAFIVVDSAEGLYLTGTITELQLDTVTEGSIVSIMSWNTGMSFEAEITEISSYPAANGYGYTSNPNVSYYPFKAYIEDSSGLSNYEYVEVTLSSSGTDQTGDTEAFYLFNAYILKENGKSYVYMRDENERLKKQEVVLGKTLYGQYSEIVTGLTQMDYVAFPYGKGIKNGVKTKEAADIYY